MGGKGLDAAPVRLPPGRYQGYGIGMTEAEVREAFEAHFQHEPEYTELTGGCWRAGPIETEEG